jgi:hypothetical protein
MDLKLIEILFDGVFTLHFIFLLLHDPFLFGEIYQCTIRVICNGA